MSRSTREFVETCRLALRGEIRVKAWWACNGLSGPSFRAWFHDRLTAKINKEDTRTWRRLDPDYQRALAQDADSVRRNISSRVIIRQFRTDIFRARLGHLIHED